jgi:hypothetical protein
MELQWDYFTFTVSALYKITIDLVGRVAQSV